eukprot:4745449-Amphidinium_carterae.1
MCTSILVSSSSSSLIAISTFSSVAAVGLPSLIPSPELVVHSVEEVAEPSSLVLLAELPYLIVSLLFNPFNVCNPAWTKY